jgi:predicted GH43/DUF377 family glycosyl hydrolase
MSIALVESRDGIRWGEPVIALEPAEIGWEQNVNRPCVVRRSDGYHVWYTGQTLGRSSIGYAVSTDGVIWTRASGEPVLCAEQDWETTAVMCPHVLWDDELRLFRMWYSGGEQFEPDAIGYATSPDGINWTKRPGNPVFTVGPSGEWDSCKVTACQVVPQGEWYVMFYIGFRDVHRAQIGLARSRDGLTDWRRHPANPIISPDPDSWDADACYKPYAIYDEQADLWRLWYNGRRGSVEQIGLATHKGRDLWLLR